MSVGKVVAKGITQVAKHPKTRQVAAKAAMAVVGAGATALGKVGADRLVRRFDSPRDEAGTDRSVVLVTGVSGVGKTVLADHVQGALQGYRPPPRESQREELRLLGPLELRVVTGHTGVERERSLVDWFHQNSVVGVVHVVANGFATSASGADRSAAESLDELREQQMEAELRELQQVIVHLRSSVLARGAGPRWMIVAIAKVDLYPDELDAVLASHTPGGTSRLAVELDDLVDQVGKGSFRWESVPVCSWLGGYDYCGIQVSSRMASQERDQYLEALRARVLHLAGVDPTAGDGSESGSGGAGAG